MALSPRLALRQSQSLVMTPQLMQSIRLLQMTHAELSHFVEEEIERNPLLEVASDPITSLPQERSEAREGDPASDSESGSDDWVHTSIDSAETMAENFDTPMDNVFSEEPGTMDLALVRPALLEREIRAHELVARRLRMLADTSPQRGTSPHEFEKAYVASSADFTRQLAAIGSESLKKAIESASRLSSVSPAATPLVDKLRRKLEVRLKGGVPNSDRPALLVMEDPSGRR